MPYAASPQRPMPSRAAPQALPTGKCECRLASSDEAPAEGVKVGEVRCASSRRVLIVRVMTRPAFCDRASTWAAGAVMRSPMVRSAQHRAQHKRRFFSCSAALLPRSAAGQRVSVPRRGPEGPTPPPQQDRSAKTWQNYY